MPRWETGGVFYAICDPGHTVVNGSGRDGMRVVGRSTLDRGEFNRLADAFESAERTAEARCGALEASVEREGYSIDWAWDGEFSYDAKLLKLPSGQSVPKNSNEDTTVPCR